ncbi:MAG: hypothetical protein KGL39_41740 [Patescibacteria group bacterium]|nr:hypothetical protein [Patescibacteria group bacterium]
MSANTLPAVGVVRQPRGLVQLDGVTIPAWIEWSVTNNAYYEADTFRVKFAESGLPAGYDANWFSQQTETFAEIFGGIPAVPQIVDSSQLTSYIYGRADSIDYDPVERTIEISGRDLTAALIDKRLDMDYANQTASQIVQSIASEHGLTADVSNASDTTKAGTYFEIDVFKLQANRSEWDLLTYLARQQGYVVYVSGHTLYYGAFEPDTSAPYVIQWTTAKASASGVPVANVKRLKLSHTQTVAKGISVTVRSASRYGSAAVQQSYPVSPRSIKAGASSPFGELQTYYYRAHAGMTAQQCAQLAESLYNSIISHEMKMDATLPGDDILTMQSEIQLTGTGTLWDQVYYPKSITRSMSFSDGYEMTVAAQNHSANLSSAP